MSSGHQGDPAPVAAATAAVIADSNHDHDSSSNSHTASDFDVLAGDESTSHSHTMVESSTHLSAFSSSQHNRDNRDESSESDLIDGLLFPKSLPDGLLNASFASFSVHSERSEEVKTKRGRDLRSSKKGRTVISNGLTKGSLAKAFLDGGEGNDDAEYEKFLAGLVMEHQQYEEDNGEEDDCVKETEAEEASETTEKKVVEHEGAVSEKGGNDDGDEQFDPNVAPEEPALSTTSTSCNPVDHQNENVAEPYQEATLEGDDDDEEEEAIELLTLAQRKDLYLAAGQAWSTSAANGGDADQSSTSKRLDLATRRYVMENAATTIQALVRGFLYRKRDKTAAMNVVHWLRQYKELDIAGLGDAGQNRGSDEEGGVQNMVEALEAAIEDLSSSHGVDSDDEEGDEDNLDNDEVAESDFVQTETDELTGIEPTQKQTTPSVSERRWDYEATSASTCEKDKGGDDEVVETTLASSKEAQERMVAGRVRQNKAATKIQAMARGHRARLVDYKGMQFAAQWLNDFKEMLQQDPNNAMDMEAIGDIGSMSSDKARVLLKAVQGNLDVAACKIQAVCRGFICRKFDREANVNVASRIKDMQLAFDDLFEEPDEKALETAWSFLEANNTWVKATNQCLPSVTSDENYRNHEHVSQRSSRPTKPSVEVEGILNTWEWLVLKESQVIPPSTNGKSENNETKKTAPPAAEELVNLRECKETNIAKIVSRSDAIEPTTNAKKNVSSAHKKADDLKLWNWLESNDMNMDVFRENKSQTNGTKDDSKENQTANVDALEPGAKCESVTASKPSMGSMISYWNFSSHYSRPEAAEIFFSEATLDATVDETTNVPDALDTEDSGKRSSDQYKGRPTIKDWKESASDNQLLSTLSWMRSRGIDLKTVGMDKAELKSTANDSAGDSSLPGEHGSSSAVISVPTGIKATNDEPIQEQPGLVWIKNRDEEVPADISDNSESRASSESEVLQVPLSEEKAVPNTSSANDPSAAIKWLENKGFLAKARKMSKPTKKGIGVPKSDLPSGEEPEARIPESKIATDDNKGANDALPAKKKYTFGDPFVASKEAVMALALKKLREAEQKSSNVKKISAPTSPLTTRMSKDENKSTTKKKRESRKPSKEEMEKALVFLHHQSASANQQKAPREMVSTPKKSTLKSAKKDMTTSERYYDDALKWLTDESIASPNAPYFSKIHAMLPLKASHTKEQRAKEIAKAMGWVKKQGVVLTGQGSKSKVSAGSKKAQSLPPASKVVSRTKDEDAAGMSAKRDLHNDDIANCLAWLSNRENGGNVKDAAYFTKLNSMLPKKAGQSNEDRARDMVKALQWVKKASAKKRAAAAANGSSSTLLSSGSGLQDQAKENLPQVVAAKKTFGRPSAATENEDEEAAPEIPEIAPQIRPRTRGKAKMTRSSNSTQPSAGKKKTQLAKQESKSKLSDSGPTKRSSSKSKKSNKKMGNEGAASLDSDVLNALKWLKNEDRDELEHASEYKKLDSKMPKRAGETPEQRAAEMAKKLREEYGTDPSNSSGSSELDQTTANAAIGSVDVEPMAPKTPKKKKKSKSLPRGSSEEVEASVEPKTTRKKKSKSLDKKPSAFGEESKAKTKKTTKKKESSKAEAGDGEPSLPVAPPPPPPAAPKTVAELDLDNALGFLRTKQVGGDILSLPEGAQFKRLDNMMPSKTGQPLEERAKDMVKMLAWLRKKGKAK